MGRRAFGKCHRQQRVSGRQVSAQPRATGEGIQNLRVHRIAGAVIHRAIDSCRMDFRSQTSMHKPFLKPDSLERAGCDLAKQGGNVWPAKSAEAILRWVTDVRIAVVNGRARSCEDQETMEVSLEKHVDVNPLADVATVSHVTRGRIENIRRLAGPALHR